MACVRLLLPGLATLAVLVCGGAGCGRRDSDSGGGGADAGLAIQPLDGGFRLMLAKSAVGQRFLLSPVLGEGPPLALSHALTPSIVTFEQHGDTLYLLEDTALGAVATDSLPAFRLLAEFPVLDGPASAAAAGTQLLIDFNKGILTYFVGLLDQAGVVPAPEVRTSYLRKAVVAVDQLFVDQVVEVPVGATGTRLAQVKYTLSPYTPRTDFPSRALDEAFAKVGYFENPPVFADARGHQRAYVNKWDVTKPVTFHVPLTIPEDYRQAVMDGILYWNRAFGSEVVQVADLPDGVTPHEPGYNVVQWLETDALDYAYADWSADPLTGEIRQAQIFVPSFFALASRDAALRFQQEATPASGAAGAWPAGFRRPAAAALALGRESARLRHGAACFGGATGRRGATLMQHLLQDGVTDAAVVRLAQDVVRAIVAHEIGHTLGLRHNFAAKNGATLAAADLGKTFDAYLETGAVPAVTVSTSVMDYLSIDGLAMEGALIRQGAPAFPYDVAAIRWGYSEDDFRTLGFSGFCTDEHEGMFPDCVTFAAPGDPIAANAMEWLQLPQRAAAGFAAKFLAAKAPLDLGASVPVEEVRLDPEADADALMARFAYVVAMLKDFDEIGASFLRSADALAYQSDLNREDEVAAILRYQKAAVKSAGGLHALLAPLRLKDTGKGVLLPAIIADAPARLAAILESGAYAGGTNAAGVAYTFTTAERRFIATAAKGYFDRLGRDIVAQATDILTRTADGRYARIDVDGLAGELKALAESYVLAESETAVSGKVNGKVVSVKRPWLDLDQQLAATDLLSHDLLDAYPDTFNEDASAKVLEGLYAKLDVITDGGDVALQDLPLALRTLANDLVQVTNATPTARR
jgi:hypothetical protein